MILFFNIKIKRSQPPAAPTRCTHSHDTGLSSRVITSSDRAPASHTGLLIKERLMMSRRNIEQTYRTWSSPILLELKKREHQMKPVERQALENVLVERRLLDTGNPEGTERRQR